MTNLLSAVLLASNLWIQATGYIHSVIYYDDLPNTNCQMTNAAITVWRTNMPTAWFATNEFFTVAVPTNAEWHSDIYMNGGTWLDGEYVTNEVRLIGISFSTVTNTTSGDNGTAGCPYQPPYTCLVFGCDGKPSVPATEKWVREVVIFRKTAKVLLDGEPFTITKDVQLSDTTKRWRLKQDWEPVVETNRPNEGVIYLTNTNWWITVSTNLWVTP